MGGGDDRIKITRNWLMRTDVGKIADSSDYRPIPSVFSHGHGNVTGE